jgi:thiamine-monophosphate kinase
MGATPLAAFLSLAIPGSLLKTKRGQTWLEGFFSGLRNLADQHKTPLAGGDTSESPADLIFADIVLIGSAPRGRALRRSTARPGDAIYVTGSLGGAHAELTSLLRTNRPSRATARDNHPHLFPQPRLAIGGTLLRRRLATAAIDISDGLSTDLTHLCESSGLRAEIDAQALPLHPLAAKLPSQETLHAALHGGEDYELLFTTPASVRIPRSIAGTRITRIGAMHKVSSRKPRITLIKPGGHTELKPAGWQHFSTP